eukprot:TRINITY_DN3420_c0_g1_i3.p1 TRINITY_DN3420_c0_g1~~TRINITY_DN3420_c0_g1_i3.p1  ORF type:complete len:195 (+),score=49.19 TRINITY_DN3420_c0_g1_i3:48-587(+)
MSSTSEKVGAVLTKEKILEAIDAGEIKIEPYDESAVGCASVDLTLSNEFRIYVSGQKMITVDENVDYKDITEKVIVEEGDYFMLPPGQACLGITEETISLSSNLCGLLEGRSRFARLGLFVHITAGFMNPGIENRQVLEIYNASANVLALVPGTKICQFIFMRTDGESKYQGKFASQDL